MGLPLPILNNALRKAFSYTRFGYEWMEKAHLLTGYGLHYLLIGFEVKIRITQFIMRKHIDY